MRIKLSQLPVSGTQLQQGEPASQALISSANGAMAQATSVAQSRPRKATAAGSTMQNGVAQRHCGATSTSREAVYCRC
jgi:hypothetical protein